MTHSLSIPTAARGKVRSYIKGHPGWDSWIDAKGIPSREALNSHLLEFADSHGLLSNVMMIIASVTGQSPAAPLQAVAKTPRDVAIADAVDHMFDEAGACDAALDAGVSPLAISTGFDAAGVLKDVDQFLSPLVRGEIEKALAPLIDAANKPAVTVEVEKVVERVIVQDADGKAVGGCDRHADTREDRAKVKFNKLFGTHSSEPFGTKEITLWNSHGLAPEVDKFYVVDAYNMAMMATAGEIRGEYVWQVGPSGSGKSTQPEQFAAYTGRRFFRFTCTKHSEVADFVGGDAAKGGDTFWVDGGLIAAMQVPGAVILIDEPTLTSPGVQAIFQAVTDDSRKYTIHATGRVVEIAEGVIFVVADNTNGAGDESGQYHGTHQSNAALVNRFRRMIRVDYMSKRQEASALVNHTNVPQVAAEHVVDFFSQARKLPEMEGVVMSLRQMVGFVNTVKDGFGSKGAFETSVLNRLPNTERAAVEALATLDWHVNFEALLAGMPLTNAASDSAAASAFNDDDASF